MGEKLAVIVGLLVQVAVALGLLSVVFMLSWNNFVTEVANAPELTFVNSLAAVVGVYLLSFVWRLGGSNQGTVNQTIVNHPEA